MRVILKLSVLSVYPSKTQRLHRRILSELRGALPASDESALSENSLANDPASLVRFRGLIVRAPPSHAVSSADALASLADEPGTIRSTFETQSLTCISRLLPNENRETAGWVANQANGG